MTLYLLGSYIGSVVPASYQFGEGSWPDIVVIYGGCLLFPFAALVNFLVDLFAMLLCVLSLFLL